MFVLQLPDTKGSLIILNSRRKNRTFDNVKICQQEGYCFRFLFAACPSFRTSFVSRLSDSAENTLSFNQSTKKRNAQKIHCSNIVLFVNNSLMSILFFRSSIQNEAFIHVITSSTEHDSNLPRKSRHLYQTQFVGTVDV